MTAKNINAIGLVSRALAGMRMADEVPTMPREVIAYLAPFAHLCGDHDAVSFLVEAMQAEAEAEEKWIPVSDRLPEEEFSGTSTYVEAKFIDGHTELNCWVWHINGLYSKSGCWERHGVVEYENRTDIIAWRPMRGDHG